MSHTLSFEIQKINQPESFVDKRFQMIEQLYNDAESNRLEFWNTQAKNSHGISLGTPPRMESALCKMVCWRHIECIRKLP